MQTSDVYLNSSDRSTDLPRIPSYSRSHSFIFWRKYAEKSEYFFRIQHSERCKSNVAIGIVPSIATKRVKGVTSNRLNCYCSISFIWKLCRSKCNWKLPCMRKKKTPDIFCWWMCFSHANPLISIDVENGSVHQSRARCKSMQLQDATKKMVTLLVVAVFSRKDPFTFFSLHLCRFLCASIMWRLP